MPISDAKNFITKYFGRSVGNDSSTEEEIETIWSNEIKGKSKEFNSDLFKSYIDKFTFEDKKKALNILLGETKYSKGQTVKYHFKNQYGVVIQSDPENAQCLVQWQGDDEAYTTYYSELL